MTDVKEIDALPAVRAATIALGAGQHGSVMLIDAMPRLVPEGSIGPEIAIVRAARVSYGAGTKSVSSDTNLVRHLMRNSHMTPFEMITLTFRVCAPKFTSLQWMRHRTGSYNEESARYSVIGSDCYVPEADEVKCQSASNRQGAEHVANDDTAKEFISGVQVVCDTARRVYDAAIKGGIAREIARIVLPEGRYTTFYWTVNLRNAFGFLKLRMDSHAQDDIREYAHAVWGILRAYCPVACAAFEDYQLNAINLTALELGALRGDAEPLKSARMCDREKNEWKVKRVKLAPESDCCAAPPVAEITEYPAAAN